MLQMKGAGDENTVMETFNSRLNTDNRLLVLDARIPSCGRL